MPYCAQSAAAALSAGQMTTAFSQPLSSAAGKCISPFFTTNCLRMALPLNASSAMEARLAGIDHRFHDTREKGDAARVAAVLTREAGADADIIAMGGDGTLNEVLNGLADPGRVRLGLIPCGSGNDFAAAAGLPMDPGAALDVVLTGEARYTDYMECSGVRGINAIGTGIDVDILRRYARMKLLKGSAAYLASLISTVAVYRARRFDEALDDGTEPHRALIACAGNGRSIGGGIPICPKAVLDDGLLDVVIVDNIPKPGIPHAFMRLMQRRVLELKSTVFKRQPALRIRSEIPMPIQIDGEIYENLPFDVKVVHGVLRFYRP